jgi:hypothetical protein
MTNAPKLNSPRRKMRQAQFFYWKIVNAAEPSTTEPPEAFDHYLTAFLCAADSVHDVAKHESRYGRLVSSWEAELSDADRKFLRLMRDVRRREVHFAGVDATKQRFEFLQDSFPGLRLVSERFLHIAGRQYGVLSACDRYLGLLAKMLDHIETSGPHGPKGR